MSKKNILEQDCRFSESLLWTLQQNAYDKSGPRGWEITNNPFIARSSAHLIVALLQDFKECLIPDEPVYLIDIGAGGGHFGYLLLKEILSLLPFPQKICLVLADNVESYLPFWKSHPRLAPYLANGQIDFAHFDPTQTAECLLLNSQLPLSSATIKNPLFAIANYFFSTIPNDLYQFVEGSLEEGRVTLSFKGDRVSLQQTPSLMKEVEVSLSFFPSKKDLYSDSRYEEFLWSYSHEVSSGRPFFLPVDAFRSIDHLYQLANGRLALLIGDKCRSTAQELDQCADHRPIVTQDGSINVDVNTHAIFKYAKMLDAKVLSTPTPPPTDYSDVVFSNSVLLFGVKSANHSALLFEALFGGSFNPSVCHKLITQSLSGKDTFSLEQILSLIEVSHYDPKLLHFYYEMDMKKTFTSLQEDQNHVQFNVMQKFWEHFYWISKRDDKIGYILAQAFYYLKRFSRAEEVLKMLIALSGDSEQFRYFLDLCTQAKAVSSSLERNKENT